MSEGSVIGIVMATLLEAEPFIRQLALNRCGEEPFEMYRGDRISLVISGIGKTHAAMASAWLILTEAPEVIVNAGAAGATDHRSELGSIYQISEVIEPDRMRFEAYSNIPDQIHGFPSVSLATQDKPVKLPEDRAALSADARLTDMEGAAVVQVCKKFKVPCYLFKFVSDTPTDHRIRENIERYRDRFCELLLPLIRDPSFYMDHQLTSYHLMNINGSDSF